MYPHQILNSLTMQARVKSNKCNKGCFIVAGMKSSLGLSVRDLRGALGYQTYSNPFVSDPRPTPNDNKDGGIR